MASDSELALAKKILKCTTGIKKNLMFGDFLGNLPLCLAFGVAVFLLSDQNFEKHLVLYCNRTISQS